MNLLNSPYLSCSGNPVRQVWLNGNLVWSGGSLWTGLGPDNNWNTAANWTSSIAPTTNSSLIFAGTTRLSAFNNFAIDTQFSKVTFMPTAGAFCLSGNKLIIGNSGFTNNSTNTQTINNNVVLSTGNNIVNCTSGPITFAGALSGTGGIVKNGSQPLTYSGVSTYTGQTIINQGTLTITSASTLNGVISGAGSLTKTGTAVLTIGGNNTYTGGTSFVSSGLAAYIVYNSSNAFGTGLFTVTGGVGRIDTGGNVTLPNSFQLTSSLQYRTTGANTITVTGDIAGAGGINKTGNGLLNLQGTLTYIGSTTITSGTIRAYQTTGASTATATFGAGLSVSFNVSPPSGATTNFRFFQGSTTNSYPSVTLVGVPAGTTATYVSATSTLSVTVP